jgi:hypothetical protein
MPEEINDLQDLPEENENEEEAPALVPNSTVSWGC